MSEYKLGDKKEFYKIAELLKYSDKWDDVAYPTLASAIYEYLALKEASE